ncbi:LPS translocon maturation chaperone LptM [Pasteurella bettyae]|uniref:Lipoprotein LppL family protein n=1 Tax=Pasteurella bettyae CCUG 2042 TaxID=1095749 RepID=I3DA19_9PAST|nr:lipoprotein [Pasteurella bettyae]EIJ68562.1 lipoprotein LppL family protein [Pasteurella bettyae CCUG 2042]SUB22728.1 putative lipoprotein [Pasteurella bettyae]
MKKFISLVILTALCTAMMGCGVKGPLYYPEQTPQKHTEQP